MLLNLLLKFPQIFKSYWRCIHNPVKHLRWSFSLSTINYFHKKLHFSCLKAVNYFRKKFHFRYLKEFWINLWDIYSKITARKMSKYGVFSAPYFPVFRPHTEIYRVDLRVQSKYGKIGTRKTPYLDTFYAVNHIDK